MPSRMRRPEEVRIPLASDEDWVVVKKHLTAGEYRRSQIRLMRDVVPGERVKLNPEEIGVSLAVEYLLEWSILDADGRTIPLRDLTGDDLRRLLLDLDPEKLGEVILAINTHNDDMEKVREQEKKPHGEMQPSPTFASVG